jgi:hypothetical protein
MASTREDFTAGWAASGSAGGTAHNLGKLAHRRIPSTALANAAAIA